MDKETKTIEYIPEIYISYAWEKQEDGTNWPPILKNLYDELISNNFKVQIDIQKLKYKDNIKTFMKELGAGRYIICIISEKYLKSLNCMYEVLQMLKYQNFQDRIFPILLSDAKIYNSSKIIHYLLYWEEKINQLNNEAKSLSNIAYAAPIFEDIEIMNEIRRALAKFGDEIGNMNLLTSETHDISNFKELIEAINSKVEIDKNTINLKVENYNLKKEVVDLKTQLENLNDKYEALLIEQKENISIYDSKPQEKEILSTEIFYNIDNRKRKRFDKFLGLSKESDINEAYKILGKPSKVSSEEKYSFATAYFDNIGDISFYKNNNKIMVISIRSARNNIINSIDLLSKKGINDEKINYLGKDKEEILSEFGTPDTLYSDNYSYRFDEALVNFICYSFNDYKCGEISVHFR